jgi:hypothetical protein
VIPGHAAVDLFEGSMSPKSKVNGRSQFPPWGIFPCSSVMYEQQRSISLHAPLNTLSAAQVNLFEDSKRTPRQGLDPFMSQINSSTHMFPYYTEANTRTLSRGEIHLGYSARQGQ